MKPPLPPLAAYVHLPWCLRKCPYCDFNSHTLSGPLPEAAYIQALLADLQQEQPVLQGRPLVSVFFGGGTPSLFSPAALEQVLARLEQLAGFASGVEITLEANPGTLDQTRFRDYRQLGINRLSIGIQSFQDPQLQALGRVHDAARARQAIDMALAASFDNFNLDLMHGLPGQTPELALADLETALAWQPAHLSWYQLTLEPDTRFWHQPPVLPDEDSLWAIQQAGQQLLASRGYQHYETSAYCQPGRQARHNLNYWTFGDFVGLGAGAHGKLTGADGRVHRRWKVRAPGEYLAGPERLAGEHPLDEAELVFEFLMNALRLTGGVPVSLFSARTGLPPERLPRQQAEQRGLLDPDPQRLVATAKGQLFLNDLLQLFLP